MGKYFPAILAFMLGLLVLMVPLIAVLLVVLPLFGFAYSYAAMVYRLSRLDRQTAVVELGGEPGFQTISGYLVGPHGKVGHFFQRSGFFTGRN